MKPSASPLAIYVHWPWCKAKCPYCDFNSHAGTPEEKTYIRGLLKEFSLWNEDRVIPDAKIAPFGPLHRQVSSIFFGGGTPSLMQAESISQVLEACHKMGQMTAETEVTVECNPTSFESPHKSLDFFMDLKLAGVNRVSLGIQGLQADWLAFLGRSHTVEEAFATLDAAQSVFENVNADVIYGLPDQALAAWTQQLETLAERGLSHISAYQLTIEKNTPFYRDVRRGQWAPISSDEEADFFEATRGILRLKGYENYEISNFARLGRVCRHNSHIWEYGDYLGIGAGAHGRLTSLGGEVIATQVVRQPEGYLRRFEQGQNALSLATALHPAEAAQEAIFSGLRLFAGLSMEMLLKRFGKEALDEALSTPDVSLLQEAGLLVADTDRLTLSEQGWAKLNGVLNRILCPLRDVHASRSILPSLEGAAYKSPQTVLIE